MRSEEINSFSVAFTTCTDYPLLTESDALIKKAFEKRGYIVHVVSWDDKSVDWKIFDAVLIRACWNYHLKINDFKNWLQYLEIQKIAIWNPAPVIEWNIHKTYIKELQRKNIQVIPTVFLDEHASSNVKEILMKHSWNEAVLKPVIGASAYCVRKIDIGTNDNEIKRELCEGKAMMLQPFMPEFQKGELSFMFFNGRFSHAAIRKPHNGGFVTNIAKGGKESLVHLDTALITQAEKALSVLDLPLLYARVDGIKRDNELIVSELEVIEPHLFVDLYPESANLFVNAFEELQTQ